MSLSFHIDRGSGWKTKSIGEKCVAATMTWHKVCACVCLSAEIEASADIPEIPEAKHLV